MRCTQHQLRIYGDVVSCIIKKLYNVFVDENFIRIPYPRSAENLLRETMVKGGACCFLSENICCKVVLKPTMCNITIDFLTNMSFDDRRTLPSRRCCVVGRVMSTDNTTSSITYFLPYKCDSSHTLQTGFIHSPLLHDRPTASQCRKGRPRKDLVETRVLACIDRCSHHLDCGALDLWKVVYDWIKMATKTLRVQPFLTHENTKNRCSTPDVPQTKNPQMR